jgi:hypothetical protein
VRKVIPITIAALIFISATGCFTNHPPEKSWPKPVSATQAGQFDGVFRNRSLVSKKAHENDKGEELFDFLTGQGHFNGGHGTTVTVRSDSDGSRLHIRLFDDHQLEIGSAELQRGTNYDLSGGFLKLYGPFSGTHGKAGNLAAGFEHQSSRLYVSTTGDLLGRTSEVDTGLLFYFLPFLFSDRDSSLWPRISPK